MDNNIRAESFETKISFDKTKHNVYPLAKVCSDKVKWRIT